MSDAVAAARAAGTPDAVLELVQGDAFLRKCLQKAKFGADLLQDTLDACDINDLTALLLGSGTLSVTEASEKLFLMQDEASLAVATCRRECLRAGVHFGDGATLDPADAAEEQEGPAEQHAVAVDVAAEATTAPSAGADAGPADKPEEAAEASPHPATPAPGGPSSAKATPVALKPHGHIPKPHAAASLPPKEKPAAKSAARASPTTPVANAASSSNGTAAAAAAAPAPTTPAPRPASGKPPLPTSTPAANGSAAKAAPPTTPGAAHAKLARPTSAPLTARGAAVGMPNSAAAARPQSALPTPSPTPQPSYARTTAAHKARLSGSKEDEEGGASTSSTPQPGPITFASTSKPAKRYLYTPPREAGTPGDEKREPRKPIFDNIRSSLLKPTAAFLAWSQGKGKKDSASPDMRASQALQGGTRSRQLTADDIQAGGPKTARGTPKASTPAGAEGAATSPTSAAPFRLASAQRHQKAQEDLARKVEEKAKAEAAACKPFKASPAPASARKSKWVPGGSSTAVAASAAAATPAIPEAEVAPEQEPEPVADPAPA